MFRRHLPAVKFLFHPMGFLLPGVKLHRKRIVISFKVFCSRCFTIKDLPLEEGPASGQAEHPGMNEPYTFSA
jgi:hypothetical protein